MKQLSGQLGDAERLVELLRKDIKEREDTIAEKERRMAELKAHNKELEKFKYVLDYKLRELKKEIEPRDEAIGRMRSTVTELDDELQKDFRHNMTLSHDLEEKQKKVESLSRELKRQRQLLTERERFSASLCRELHRLVTSTEPSLWKNAIKDIYRCGLAGRRGRSPPPYDPRAQRRTYVKGDSSAARPETSGGAAHAEILRQREYMERAIGMLKGRVERTEEKRNQEHRGVINEKQQLISEVNTLRVENKELKERVQTLHARMRVQDAKAASAALAPVSRPATSHSGGAGSVRGARGLTPGLPTVLDEAQPGQKRRSPISRSSASTGLLRRSSLASGHEKTRAADMLARLEEADRERQSQRAEIKRLRAQLQGATPAVDPASAAGSS